MAIDGARIVHAIMEEGRIRDVKGVIPLFGVYLSFFSVHFYNRLSFTFEERMGEERAREAEALLIEAAQECGYATFHGIRNSSEWEELVGPMIDEPEDVVKAFTTVAVAFGWGDLEVVEFVPDEKLVMRGYRTYESAGYLQLYEQAASGKCYMLRGVTGAFMDLLYGPPYPDGCSTFLTEEPLCRAKGDSYCEFIAERKRS